MTQFLPHKILSTVCNCLAVSVLQLSISTVSLAQSDSDPGTQQPTAELMAKAAKIRPSVVRIGVMERVASEGRGAYTTLERPIGSGFVIAPDGRILTQARIVMGLDSVLVTFADGRKLQGKVVMTDRPSDLAVVKVDKGNVEPIPVYHADQVRMQAAFTVAPDANRAFRLISSIVAPANRLPVEKSTDDFYPPIYSIGVNARTSQSVDTPVAQIQRSISLDPLNFGSPVLSETGEVVGVLAGVQSLKTGGFILSAIPIYGLPPLALADQIIARGKIAYGYAGFTLQEFVLPGDFGLPDGALLVSQVSPQGPAARAGLRPGDLLVAYSGRALGKMSRLARQIMLSKPSTSADVRILRGDMTHTARLTLGERPDDPFEKPSDKTSDSGLWPTDLKGIGNSEEYSNSITMLFPWPDISALRAGGGFEVAELGDAERAKFGPGSGVVVRKLSPELEKSGIGIGDVIVRGNTRVVNGVDQFNALLSTETKQLTLLILGDQSAYIAPFREDTEVGTKKVK